MLRILLYISTVFSILFLGLIFYSNFLYIQSGSPGRHEILVIAAYGTLWLLPTTTFNLLVKYFFKLELSKREKLMVWFPLTALVVGNGIQYLFVSFL